MRAFAAVVAPDRLAWRLRRCACAIRAYPRPLPPWAVIERTPFSVMSERHHERGAHLVYPSTPDFRTLPARFSRFVLP